MHLPVFSDSKHCLRGMQMCMCTHEYTCRYQGIPVIVCAGKCTASMDTAEIDGSAVSPKSAGSTVKSISTDPVKSPDLQGPLKIAGCQRVSSVRSSSASVWRSVEKKIRRISSKVEPSESNKFLKNHQMSGSRKSKPEIC